MLLALALACSTFSETSAGKPTAEMPRVEAAKQEAPAAPRPGSVPAYGEPVDEAAAVPVDQVVADAGTWAGKPVTVKGTVKEVCQKKGCWHTIATADPAVNVMVKDKAYGIFLPFDAAGKTVLVKGTFNVETIPLEEARHYAEDAGKDPSTITEPQKSFMMDADGVRLL